MWTRPEAHVCSSRNVSMLERSHFWSRTLQPENHRAETNSRDNQPDSCHRPAVCYSETSAQESVSPLVKTDISFKPGLLPFKLPACWMRSACWMVGKLQKPPASTIFLCGGGPSLTRPKNIHSRLMLCLASCAEMRKEPSLLCSILSFLTQQFWGVLVHLAIKGVNMCLWWFNHKLTAQSTDVNALKMLWGHAETAQATSGGILDSYEYIL